MGVVTHIPDPRQQMCLPHHDNSHVGELPSSASAANTERADPEALQLGQRPPHRAAAGAGNASDAEDLVLALDEAASNAVTHGSTLGSTGQITIHASQVEHVVLLAVTDQGRWVLPTRNDRDAMVNARGLEIIGSLVTPSSSCQ